MSSRKVAHCSECPLYNSDREGCYFIGWVELEEKNFDPYTEILKTCPLRKEPFEICLV